VTVLNGLDALDADRERKTARNRSARPVPKPKRYVPATEAAPAPLEVTEPEDTKEEAASSDEPAAAPKASERPAKAARTKESTRAAEKIPAVDDGPLRPAQLYLDPTTDDHLRRIKAAALVERSDVTNSAVVRRAVAELVERHGYDGIVRLIDNDPHTARGKGRPRR
jgi:hypothetical protein